MKKSGMPPGPRAGFSMCVHKKRAVLFGGVVDMEVEGQFLLLILISFSFLCFCYLSGKGDVYLIEFWLINTLLSNISCRCWIMVFGLSFLCSVLLCTKVLEFYELRAVRFSVSSYWKKIIIIKIKIKTKTKP